MKYQIELNGVSAASAQAEVKAIIATLLETTPAAEQAEYVRTLQNEARDQGVEVDSLQKLGAEHPNEDPCEVKPGMGVGVAETILIGIAVAAGSHVAEKLIDYIVLKLKRKWGEDAATRSEGSSS